MRPSFRQGVGDGGGGCVSVGQLPSLLRHPLDQVAAGGHRQPGTGGDQEAAAGQSEGGCDDEGKSVKEPRRREILIPHRMELSTPCSPEHFCLK